LFRRQVHYVVLVIPLLSAASTKSQTPPPTTFRSDTSLVVGDVVARDNQGNPVPLKSGDLRVCADGKGRWRQACRCQWPPNSRADSGSSMAASMTNSADVQAVCYLEW